MAELADAPDLGSGALRRGGSSPFSRTNFIAPFEVLFFLPKNVGYRTKRVGFIGDGASKLLAPSLF